MLCSLLDDAKKYTLLPWKVLVAADADITMLCIESPFVSSDHQLSKSLINYHISRFINEATFHKISGTRIISAASSKLPISIE